MAQPVYVKGQRRAEYLCSSECPECPSFVQVVERWYSLGRPHNFIKWNFFTLRWHVLNSLSYLKNHTHYSSGSGYKKTHRYMKFLSLSPFSRWFLCVWTQCSPHTQRSECLLWPLHRSRERSTVWRMVQV